MRAADVMVVGGGIIGLTSACELQRRFPGLAVLVLEAEQDVGTHQTATNHGVVHADGAATMGSVLTTRGAAEVYAYCDAKGITYRRCGKLYVAAVEDEAPQLEAMYQRGRATGLTDLELIGPERIRELEPACAGVRALWAPGSGLADYPGVARALANDVRAAGGEVLTGHPVVDLRQGATSSLVTTLRGDFEARHVLVCAGLYADRLARATGAPADPTIVPLRASHFALPPERTHLVRGLILPVPNPAGLPLRGIHFTHRLDGRVWLGPNVAPVFIRDGWGRDGLAARDLRDLFGAPGGARLLAQNWRPLLAERVPPLRKSWFLEVLRRYVPDIRADDLRPGPSGTRAQAVTATGQFTNDFITHPLGRRILHVRNVPAPGATSSFPIGRLVADRATEVFGLAA